MRDRPGRDVSRIEGFSDAVFGFALTLLVASIEVPPDFQTLKQTLRVGLTPEAVYDAGTGMRANFLSMMLGVTSVTLALALPMKWFGFAGLIYLLEGPIQAYNGFARGSARAKKFPAAE